MIRIWTKDDPEFEARLRALENRAATVPEHIEAAARDIIRAVRRDGDAAVREFTKRFEGRDLPTLELPPETWRGAADQIAPGVRIALKNAAARIRAFAEHERQASFEIQESGGPRIGSRIAPLARAGLYVPGGTARYPSSVLMTAIPARVAGVREIVMTTPGPSPETLAAAAIAGVDRVFSIGGAQAIAALAYGTETVPRVDKIVGPGNAYVAAAKRLVFGDVGIDAIAGPTELVIAADDSARADWIAADLLAQAEHDVLAVPVLVTVGRAMADAVAAELARQVALLPRRQIAERSLDEQGAIFVVSTTAEAVAIVDRLAPEHAELALADPRAWADQVTTAGALFLGHHTPESVGDYVAGPSHVLPTAGSARFASPLGVAD
ncbi:MAG: histidinol dehydrogenase, partial [Haliangium ochraceum]